MDVLLELKQLADDNYRVFNSRIIPTRQVMLGVRVPALREITRKIAKEDPLDFIRLDKGNIFELILLEGMVLSNMDQPFMDLLPYTGKFLDKVDNWAQIDTTVCDFKRIAEEKDEVITVVQKWLASEKEFVVRAGLVILLAHYIAEENLQMIFELSQGVSHTGYYVHMGNAWLISACMAKYPEETIEFFKSNTLDAKTHNKAIQKSRESHRVSKEHKTILKKVKKSSGR